MTATISRGGAALLSCALLLIAALAPSSSASATSAGDRAAANGWTITAKQPPQWTSDAGGVASRNSPYVFGEKRHTRIMRFDTSSPPQVVDTIHRVSHGDPIGNFILDDGTIIVISAQAHQYWALTWPEGGDPGPWTHILTDVKYAHRVDVTMDADENIAVATDAWRRGVTWLTTYSQGTGWTPQRSLPPVDDSGSVHPGGFKLGPDGQIESVAVVPHDDGTYTTAVLRMPLDGNAWASRDVLANVDHPVDLIYFEPGRGAAVAFNFSFGSRWDALLGLVTAGGVVHTREYHPALMVGLHVDGPNTARFVTWDVGDGPVRGWTYDGGWEIASMGNFDSEWFAYSSTNTAGDMVIGAQAGHNVFDRIFAARWSKGQPPPRMQQVAPKLDIAAAMSLDSGHGWVKGLRNGETPRWVYVVYRP